MPLVGPSGRIFNKMLNLAGIDRADCWVGNVFDFKLPGNSIKSICTKERNDFPFPGAGYITPDFHGALSRLAGELGTASPMVVVPLGGTAVWAFTGHTDITKSRGALTTATRVLPGAKLLPTFHPAYVLHSYGTLGTVVADFKKAWAEAQGGQELTARELWLEPALADMLAFQTRHLLSAELITVDIETAMGQITCIGFGADQHRAICVPFVDFRKPSRSYWDTVEDEVAARRTVARWLDSPTPKLFQNGLYDVWWLLRDGYRVRNWREDTRLQQHAREPEEPKSLAFMASRWAKVGPWKLMASHAKGKRDDI